REAKLTHELQNNPVLEELSPDASASELPGDSSADADDNDESRLDERGAEADEWNDELPLPPAADTRRGDEPAAEYLANSPAPPPALEDLLFRELATCGATERERNIGRVIIDSLDDRGYLTTPLADVAMSCDADLPEVEAALKLVQSFDPAGIGARNLGEALKLQLQRQDKLTPVMAELVDSHLDDIAKNKLPQVARTLGISINELNGLLAELKKLDPAPAARFRSAPESFVVPELEIRRERDGSYSVRLLRERRREVVISEHYLQMLENPATDPETRAYVRDRVNRARELLAALDRRKSTLEKLGEVIVATQKDFLEHGVKALHPLTMKHAGELMRVDESVVSRAAADKLVVTPQGVFPCRFFFSSGFSPAAAGNGSADSGVSSRAVMERIRELIADEDPARPLSDNELAAMLKDDGTPVARRTVAKYREALRIPAAALRRRRW
ncbi:MAG: RNA polymerase factor sigma-54, partial [Lentisphaeria bacterium]|nr:RNA polymerase factor sigma-54 [Lentisphaeria bacterium]